ncbi:MAG: hypothetical protein AAF802_19305 [Planctomycetota bacterium]
MKRAMIIACGALALPLVLFTSAWIVLVVLAYIAPATANRNHQEFAENGVQLIEPAAQMDATFSDCRHFVTYFGEPSRPVWNSVAYFGGRYELAM